MDGCHTIKNFEKENPLCVISHGDLVHMEGTAHIDLSRFETTEAINFKILPVMHMQKL